MARLHGAKQIQQEQRGAQRLCRHKRAQVTRHRPDTLGTGADYPRETQEK